MNDLACFFSARVIILASNYRCPQASQTSHLATKEECRFRKRAQKSKSAWLVQEDEMFEAVQFHSCLC